MSNEATTGTTAGCGDVAKTVDAGANAGPGHRIEISDQSLNFRQFTLTDPVPLGRQILQVAGFRPPDEHSLFAILPSGDFEELRLDEQFDLRARGVERFVVFRTDRDFRFKLGDAQLTWGESVIRGAALYQLGGVGDDQAVYLEVRGGQDQVIELNDTVDLSAPGVERFVIGPRRSQTIEIILNTRRRTVTDPHLTFEQLVQMAFPGPQEPNTLFSITYRQAASRPQAGELGAGGAIEVKNGTIINVTRTVQS